MRARALRSSALIAGKVRRFALVRFRPAYVVRGVESRLGECNRCGRCCEILFRCPFLVKVEEETRCRIYGRRFDQCMAFPIDKRDLADVDFNCSFTFRETTLLQIDQTGLGIGTVGPGSDLEATPERRGLVGHVRRAGIKAAVMACLGLLKAWH